MEYKSPHVRMRDVSRIYDALEIGIIITTGSGIIVWGNRYYSQLAQFDIRDYFGHDVREISQREDVLLPTASYIIDIVLQTRQPQTEIVQYRTEDYVLTTATPIFDKNDEIDYIIYSVTNYSELMRLREKVSESGMKVLALENHLRNLQVDAETGREIVIASK